MLYKAIAHQIMAWGDWLLAREMQDRDITVAAHLTKSSINLVLVNCHVRFEKLKHVHDCNIGATAGVF